MGDNNYTSKIAMKIPRYGNWGGPEHDGFEHEADLEIIRYLKIKIIKRSLKLFFIIVSVYIIGNILYLVSSHSFESKADQEQASEKYPATPEKVVEAFVKAYFNDIRPKDEYRYFPDENDRTILRNSNLIDTSIPWGYASDHTHIIRSYEVRKATISGRKARVEVVFDRIGWMWRVPKEITECRQQKSLGKDGSDNSKPSPVLETAYKIVGEKQGWVWDADGCKFLHITNDRQMVTYKLVKPANYWRLYDVYELRVSVANAIERFNNRLSPLPSSLVGRVTEYSKSQIEQIKNDIEILKGYLNNEDSEVK